LGPDFCPFHTAITKKRTFRLQSIKHRHGLSRYLVCVARNWLGIIRVQTGHNNSLP
jgi:hypothetical protein